MATPLKRLAADGTRVTPRVSPQSTSLLRGDIDVDEYFEEVSPEVRRPQLEAMRQSARDAALTASLLSLGLVLIFLFGALGLLASGRNDDAYISFLGAGLLAAGLGQVSWKGYLTWLRRNR